MTYDELLARLSETAILTETFNNRAVARALRAVVQLIKEKQDWLELTSGDIPMTNEQLYRREERWLLLAEFKSAIEKELK